MKKFVWFAMIAVALFTVGCDTKAKKDTKAGGTTPPASKDADHKDADHKDAPAGDTAPAAPAGDAAAPAAPAGDAAAPAAPAGEGK